MTRLLFILGAIACSDSASETDQDTREDSDAPGESEDTPPDDTQPSGETLTEAFTLTGDAPSNVVILSVDTLRWDRMSLNGYTDDSGLPTTPNLDSLLESGVLLSNHRACSSWTFPSFLCALSGMDQITLGFWPTNVSGEDPGKAPDSIPFLAEYLQAAGYHTMLASNSGFMGQAGNLNQGYAEGDGFFPEEENDWLNAERVMDDGLARLDQHLATNPDQPWLLHVHLIDPHMPYNPPESYLSALEKLEPISYDLTTEEGTQELWANFEFLSEVAKVLNMAHLRARYDAEAHYTDDQIGRLVTTLESLDAWDDTVLLFFVDHGEEFWEHENFNHGYTAFEEVTRVTAGFVQPGNLEPVQWE